MILNDVLKRHRRCLTECDKKHELCEIKQPDGHDCAEKRDSCSIVCDFDHSPN